MVATIYEAEANMCRSLSFHQSLMEKGNIRYINTFKV